MGAFALLLCAAALVGQALGFYLPGVAPADFRRKDLIYLKVNKLSSTRNQLPFEYYSLPYCRPEHIVQSAENLGEVLRGDRLENSLYQVMGCEGGGGGGGGGAGGPGCGGTHACTHARSRALTHLSPPPHAHPQIQMRVDEQCKVLCRIEALSGAQAKAFKAKIEDDYRVNM